MIYKSAAVVVDENLHGGDQKTKSKSSWRTICRFCFSGSVILIFSFHWPIDSHQFCCFVFAGRVRKMSTVGNFVRRTSMESALNSMETYEYFIIRFFQSLVCLKFELLIVHGTFTV